MTLSNLDGAAALSNAADLTDRPGAASARGARNPIAVVATCLIGNMVSPTPIIHGPLGQFVIPISMSSGGRGLGFRGC